MILNEGGNILKYPNAHIAKRRINKAEVSPTIVNVCDAPPSVNWTTSLYSKLIPAVSSSAMRAMTVLLVAFD